MALSDRIQKALSANPDLSQSGLARACGVSRASVNGWTSGRSASIDGKHLTTAAKYLGVSAHWLSTGEGSMRPGLAQPQQAGGRFALSDLAIHLATTFDALPDEVRAQAFSDATDAMLRARRMHVERTNRAPDPVPSPEKPLG